MMIIQIKETKMTNKRKLVKEFVQIEKLEIDTGRILYLLKIADIPVRPYITDKEAYRIATYMRLVVDSVIVKFNQNNNITGNDLVKIEQPSTNAGILYLMSIADLHIRGYIDGYESLVQKNFMIGVVDEIIKQLKQP